MNKLPAIVSDKEEALTLVSRVEAVLGGTWNAPVVHDDASYAKAGEVLKVLKGKEKELADKKAKILSPLSDATKAVRELFSVPEGLLKGAINLTGQTMLDWKRKRDHERAETLRLAQAKQKEEAEAEKARLLVESQQAAGQGRVIESIRLVKQAERSVIVGTPVQVDLPPAPMAPGLGTRKTWKAEVVDAAAVPRQWCVPDLARLNALARETKGAAEVAGVRIYCEENFVNR